MATTIEETFQSPPEKVREGIMAAFAERFPEFVHLLSWAPDGRTAAGSKMGAKGTLVLAGDGPTTATLTFSIGFPASMKYSENDAAAVLSHAIKELKSRVP